MIAMLGLGLAASFATADTLVYTYTFDQNTNSYGALGDINNVVVNLDLGTIFAGYEGFEMSGVGWDVDLEAFSPSWLSEIGVQFNESTGLGTEWISLNPGVGTDTSGTGTFSSALVTFSSVSLPNIVLNPDNVLRMEFFESFDDSSVAPDGQWLAGSTLELQFEAQAVPEPATMAILGLGAAALLRRRRK